MPELAESRGVSLEQLQDRIELLCDLIEAAETAEQRSEYEQELTEVLRTELPQKVDNIAGFLRYCKEQALAAEHMRQWADRGIARWTNRHDSLRRLVRTIMQRRGIRHLKGPLSSISLRAGAESVEIISMRELPLEYFHPLKPPKLAPDLDKIKRDLRAQIAVPGAELVSGDDILQIR